MAGSPTLVAKAIAIGAAGASAIVAVGLMLAAQPWARSLEYTAVSLLALFGALFVIAALFAVTLGLMWHKLASNRNWRSVHVYSIAGLLVGALVPSLWVGTAVFQGAYLHVLLLLSGIGAALGGLTGLFAWLIRRPDRDAPNPDRPTP